MHRVICHALALVVLCGLTVPGSARAQGSHETTVRGEDTAPGERTRITGEELRSLPGTLGDPLRAVGLLAGVSTPLPLLPLYALRGAAPGMSAFYVDGMRVPQVFHLFVGGSVIHPALIDQMDFFPGAYDATIGHQAGGIISATTRPARPGIHGEVELRPYDLSAAAELGLPRDVRLSVTGRYGNPGLILRVADPRIDASYWDYHLRLDRRGFTVQALGAHDSLRLDPGLLGSAELLNPSLRPEQSVVTFHRVQARVAGRSGRAALSAAIHGGYDETGDHAGQSVRKLSLGLRMNARVRLPHLRLAFGIDGEIGHYRSQDLQVADPEMRDPDAKAPVPRDDLGDLGQERLVVITGAFAQGTVDLFAGRLLGTAGVRLDVYHGAAVTLLGVDPRFTLRARPTRWLAIEAGGGVYQQPPTYSIALPGFDNFALQLGLQRAVHGAVSQELSLPASFTFKLGGYYQRFSNVTEPTFDPIGLCQPDRPIGLSGQATRPIYTFHGESSGMEALLRRHAGRVTGWIAYTLSRADRVSRCGRTPAIFDQSHVLNVVAQVRLPWRLLLGARLQVASGRPVTQADPDDLLRTRPLSSRLPTYVQLDVRLDRTWTFRRFALSAFIEVVNVTGSELQISIAYPIIQQDGREVIDYRSPQVQGFRWLLPSVGLRAVL